MTVREPGCPFAFDPSIEMESEQQRLAAEASASMAALFGVNGDDFWIVRVQPDLHTDPQLTVVYGHTEGIDLGNPGLAQDPDRSWEGIWGSSDSRATADRFTLDIIDIDGVPIDTRQAMTAGVYKAMVSQSQEHPSPPDRPQTEGDLLATWLTGETVVYGARFGYVNDRGETKTSSAVLDQGGRHFRFRPGVTLSLLEAGLT